jgi:HSP20 family protein
MVGIELTERPFKTPPGASNKFLEQLHGKGYYTFFPNEHWTPNVNLYETDSVYLVCVDLAGVEKNKIEIELVDGRLTIRGNRAVPSPAEAGGATRIRMHLMEIDHGHFARDVEMPQNVHHDRISAKYTDGLLWIELPKRP